MADHAGQLKGIPALISAVQSSISSWSAAAVGVGAVLLASIAIVVALLVYFAQRTDGQITDAQNKIEATKTVLQGDIAAVSNKLQQDSSRITDVERSVRDVDRSVQDTNRKVDVLGSVVGNLSDSSRRIEDSLKALSARKTRP